MPFAFFRVLAAALVCPDASTRMESPRKHGLSLPRIDAAFDLVGSDVLPELIELVGEPRNVVSIANPKAAELGAQASFGNTLPNPEIAFAKAAELSQKGEFRMPVEEAFALVDAAEAHKRSQSGRVTSKLAITLEA